MFKGMIGVTVLVVSFGLYADPVMGAASGSDVIRGSQAVHWAGDYKCIEGDTLVRWPGDYQGVALVPPEVRKIGDIAFVSCKGVTGVRYMGPVESIGREAFMFCDGLREMEIPSTVTSIGESAFYSCRSLTNLVIRSGVVKLPDRMCKNCLQLKNVELEGGLQEIGEGAFAECRSLTRLVFPVGVKSIGAGAFLGCGRLREIVLPSTVQKIGKNAFGGCYDLGRVLPNLTLTAEEMKACGMTPRSDSVSDENGLKGALKIAANGFASKHTAADDVRFAAMDVFASCSQEICIGTDRVDIERCIKSSGASETICYGERGISDIDVSFGWYQGDFIEIKMKIEDGKVSNIEFNETLKKGIRLGLELRGETPGERILSWL